VPRADQRDAPTEVQAQLGSAVSGSVGADPAGCRLQGAAAGGGLSLESDRQLRRYRVDPVAAERLLVQSAPLAPPPAAPPRRPPGGGRPWPRRFAVCRRPRPAARGPRPGCRPGRCRGIVVLIPANNEEAQLGLALESVLRQSRPVDRIIVVSDNSTDRTRPDRPPPRPPRCRGHRDGQQHRP
jgi:hypothetical protein